MSVESTWQKTQQIRELFRPIEKNRWGLKEYSVELLVQIGHLGDILLRQEYKMNNMTDEENQRRIGDEIADVILNTFSIAKEYGLEITSLISGGNRDNLWEEVIENSLLIYPNPVDSIELFSDLSVRGAHLLQNIVNSSNLESLIIDLSIITNISARLAGIYGVDIDTVFSIIQEESELYVNKHLNAE